MPTNEQRRAAAKRKLERRMARQAQRARKRKQLAIAGSAVGVVVVVAAGVGIYYLTRSDDDTANAAAATPETSQPELPPAAPPPPAAAKPATVNCSYPDAGQAARPVQKPEQNGISTTEARTVTMQTNRGPIGLSLDAGKSPCTVNSFVSLVQQKFYDDTPCHRLSTSPGLKVLQCGDPSGKGTGGPGYSFANEYPTDQYAPGDMRAQKESIQYERGVIAMANSGPDTNGSQFFLVYGDSQLPPQFTIFGTIDEHGLQTLDAIADDGTAGPGRSDGAPKKPVTVESMQLT